MTISWGWKIALVYVGFMAMIICLVVASSSQKIDLVSKDYYKDEIAYQHVLDASKNEAGLQGLINIHANKQEVTIDFPAEFKDKILTGNINFYSVVNDQWDRNFNVNATKSSQSIPRQLLQRTTYTVKVSYTVDGKSFYYETRIDLHAS